MRRRIIMSRVLAVVALNLVTGQALTVARGEVCDPPTVAVGGPRYFSVTPSATNPGAVALVMTIETPAPGCTKYLDLDNNPIVRPFNIGRVKPAPVFRTAEEWGTFHVRGREVIPSTTYVIQANCGSEGAPDLSTSVSVTTPIW